MRPSNQLRNTVSSHNYYGIEYNVIHFNSKGEASEIKVSAE